MIRQSWMHVYLRKGREFLFDHTMHLNGQPGGPSYLLARQIMKCIELVPIGLDRWASLMAGQIETPWVCPSPMTNDH